VRGPERDERREVEPIPGGHDSGRSSRTTRSSPRTSDEDELSEHDDDGEPVGLVRRPAPRTTVHVLPLADEQVRAEEAAPIRTATPPLPTTYVTVNEST